ncbi:Protocatechuate 3 4-dioxygenase beta subunit like protein [Nitrosococcus oceani ATCC 19707]|uniref:Protocatechuate 3 4-dioxygenase beta subunit like protein n=2 Tax=Nitrosococcus oceani TaxID=1229 RepID=Q3JC14_NITOC|nr:intradiol ring-cleavage dioxygenase [Nitrosococcus oceani]ABA57632.1 Protocatechuate 3 4-dioxygenase beta subunit like protein [Nitrosococcus oceani ATCC 19707]KFI19917.1 twin-arginine translocation pathway signal protein [Nitrosococcus oceani C-27]GEM19272.1 twin-arginine translocation pathway signal protein [Nitrosococcus oceani]
MKITGCNLSRRRMLLLTGVTAASLVMGKRVSGQSMPRTPTQTPLKRAMVVMPSCVVRPQQTEGPYFVDEKLNRSDIRFEPSDHSMKKGVPLRLVFRVSQLEGNVCTPLKGAIVDVWQCDALGVYSGFQDINGLFDTRGKKFLRGYQITDAIGKAEFVTIYPGWYPGRTVHIHFKIRTDSASPQGHEFTSQLYFHDSITDRVHAQAPYATKGRRNSSNEDDRIFQRGGSELILPLARETAGYVGTFDIGLQMT